VESLSYIIILFLHIKGHRVSMVINWEKKKFIKKHPYKEGIHIKIYNRDNKLNVESLSYIIILFLHIKGHRVPMGIGWEKINMSEISKESYNI